jgi:hypothetical protein
MHAVNITVLRIGTAHGRRLASGGRADMHEIVVCANDRLLTLLARQGLEPCDARAFH